MKKVSISLVDIQQGEGDKAAVETAKRIGADGIDFDLFVHDVRKENDVYARGEAAVIEYFEDIKRFAEEIGVEIAQTHGRMFGYGLSADDTAAFVRNTELDMLATAVLGAKHCVIHSPSIAWVADGDKKSGEEMEKVFSDMLDDILPFAKKHGLRIAVETHGFSHKLQKMEYFGYIDKLAEAIDRAISDKGADGYICVCVDTGHTNMTVRHGNPTVGDAIRQLGSRVEVLHLHDNDGVMDQHKIPKMGIIDWDDILAALGEIGYGGWYNLENNINNFGKGIEEAEAEFSVKVLRNMIKA